MTPEMVTAYLGLGTNMGNRQDNINRALVLLGQRMKIENVSSTYDTEPVGNTDQPRFLNIICQIHTTLPPAGLLALVKGIEIKLGRVKYEPDSPRPMDIDILFYGNEIIETPELVIPHPRLAERAFVLIPLAEIAPNLVHPVSGKTIEQLLKDVQSQQGVLKWENG